MWGYSAVNGLLVVVLPLILVSRVIYTSWIRSRLYRFPPGPVPLPFLGNVHQLPLNYQERTILQWGKKYGDIIYTRFFQTHAILLNSAEVAQDLLEKRSAKYSSRPHFVMQTELMGWDSMLVHMPYDTRFRKLRRWIHDSFMTNTALVKYRPLQLRETYIMLAGLLASPDDFVSHLTRFSGAIIMEITYGHTVTSSDDYFIGLADKAAVETAESGSPGSMLVDFIPILKYYPTWLPGSGWKVKALKTRESVQHMINVPFQSVIEELTAGTARPSFVSSLLEECYRRGKSSESSQDKDDIKAAAAMLYAAGSETTATVLSAFILAMVKYPRVFKKAQEEIDRVIGHSRLPDFDDRDSLPYLDCVIKELYRWHPALPLGVPHYSTADDEYNGHTIPARSMMIANIWVMTRDTVYFPDPEEFRPERFLDQNTVDARDMVFGFGRRSCPGQNFADSNIYLIAANIIATMDISKAKDKNGVEITPPHAYNSGFVHRVLPFRCSIRPRSQEMVDMIEQLNM